MVQPLLDRVLLSPQEPMTKTASGLYIPDTSKSKTQEGIVIAAGPGKKDEPMAVAVGDKVIYSNSEYSNIEINADGQKLLLVRQSDILAIVK